MRTMENMIHAAIEAAIECPNISREGLVQNIIDRIHVALIAAVYAGHIEGDEKVVSKFNGIGADSYQHREEYMNYAANFVFPRNSEGKIESDSVFNEVSDYMWRNYCDPQPLYTPICPHGYEDCPAGERYDDEDK